MIYYYIIFFIVAALSIQSDRLTLKSQKTLLYLTGIILILFSGLRGEGIDRDYLNYKSFFAVIPEISQLFINPKAFFQSVRLEPSFILIFSFLKSFFTNAFPIGIFIFAALGVLLKIKALSKLTDFVLLSGLIYFSNLFLQQEMTQIRAGIASGIILLSIPSIEERNFKKFCIHVIIALSFHLSAVVFFGFYFLNPKKINKLAYVLLLTIPIVVSVLGIDPISLLLNFDFGVFSDKFTESIKIQKDMNIKMNLFSFHMLIQLSLSLFFICFSEKTGNKYTVLLTKLNCFSIIIFYLLIKVPIVSYRLSELIGSVQIILIPFLLYIIKPKVLGESIVIIIAFLYLLNQVLINPIFTPYTTILN